MKISGNIITPIIYEFPMANGLKCEKEAPFLSNDWQHDSKQNQFKTWSYHNDLKHLLLFS